MANVMFILFLNSVRPQELQPNKPDLLYQSDKAFSKEGHKAQIIRVY